MPHPYRSVDDGLAQHASFGHLSRCISQNLPLSTAANATSGFNTIRRMPTLYTMPALGGSVEGCVMTRFSVMAAVSGVAYFAAIEVLLGTLNMATGAFTDGVAMPTNRKHFMNRAGVQVASLMPVCRVSAAVTATAPVITTTYVNEDGTGSRTCTMTLPNNAALNSCFLMAPHLQTGDTGIRDITAATRSVGSAGTIQLHGLLPLSWQVSITATGATAPVSPLWVPTVDWDVIEADTIGFYAIGSAAATNAVVDFEFLGVSA